jgi:thiol-disulfide isomerase/thioredoxin
MRISLVPARSTDAARYFIQLWLTTIFKQNIDFARVLVKIGKLSLCKQFFKNQRSLMKTSKLTPLSSFVATTIFIFAAAFFVSAQAPAKSVPELQQEVENYVANKTRELLSQGKRIDADKREDLANEKKSVAGKYAAEAAARPDLAKTDFYYLGLLYVAAEDNVKGLETMKKFLAQYPPDTIGDMIQSARSYAIILASRRKLMAEAEQFYQAWLKGDPLIKTQQPMLESIMATGFFKDGQYEPAIKYGQEAFDLVKTFEAKNPRDKRDKEQIYMNLVEVLALSYKKNKNSDLALSILAEARAQSFTIPSANLYRKVMDFVAGSGFSEKKLMQKVESYATADPAPDIKILEWLGQDAVNLSSFRGKIVLLDFWATWCGPCIATFPRLRDWHKRYGGNDFVIVGVTKYYGGGGGKPLTKLQELDFLGDFKQKYKLPYPIAVAEQVEDSMKYGISAYPTTILLDRNGVVRYIGIGAGMEESENLEEMIKKLLKEEPRLASAQK